MKKSQRDTFTPTEDFEDLTLFANESFDTQDVDLFEFTSEESSPLTRLKSIILSLDWEINDEILQELADELANLQAMWQGDKVAEVYLQGLMSAAMTPISSSLCSEKNFCTAWIRRRLSSRSSSSFTIPPAGCGLVRQNPFDPAHQTAL